VHARGARLLNECTTKEVSLRTYWGETGQPKLDQNTIMVEGHLVLFVFN
jgi:hypothetical protein